MSGNTKYPGTREVGRKMVLCCKCNRTGRCRNCACVKAGKSCLNCLPTRLGQFTNSSIASSLPSTLSTVCPPAPAVPSSSPTSALPVSSPCHNPTSTQVMSVCGAMTSTPDIPYPPSNPISSSPTCSSSLPRLPASNPMAALNHLWSELDSASFPGPLRMPTMKLFIGGRTALRFP